MRNTLFLASTLVLLAPAAFACETWTAGDLSVTHARSRATIGADRPAVFYVEVTNKGSADDALIGIETPIAAMPMLHETVVTDGVASMPHAMSVAVPAGVTTELTPGGFHGMLMGLTSALKEGDRFPVTLSFERAGDITVDVEVVSMRDTGPSCEDGN